MRKLLVGFLFLLLVAPASSNSVGFGEVDLQSFLNQPLRAEIPLRGAAAVADSLRIRQASEDAYRRAGLNRGGVPGDLNIEVEGDRVVLTTRRPVREPYVGILLEARWDGGRSMREVSLLLDPPGTMPSGAASPSVSQAPDTAPRTPREGETIRVRSGDTLYAVVRRSGISGYSDEQAMLAFLDANPQAFIGNNINSLRADAELRTPTREQLDARSTAEARAEVADQTRSWQESTRAAREEPEPAPAEDDVAAVEDEAEAVDEEAVAAEEPATAVEDDEAAVADADPAVSEDDAAAVEESVSEEAAAEDRLEIVADLLPEDAEAGAAQGGSEELLQEALLSQRAEMEGMRQELSELRDELGERGRLADISSENMAELEEQLSQLRAEREQLRTRLDRADAERNAPLHERIMNDPLLLMMAIALVILLLLVLLAFARGGRREVMADDRGTGLKPRADNSKVQASTMATAGYEAREVEGSDRGAGAGASGAATAAAAGTIVGTAASRSDDVEETTQEESAHPPAEPEEGVGEVVVSSTGEGAAGMDDVLAEVDVCLAYGMNDQAVETLNAALKENPDNKQYRLKLVEAHVALEDEAGAREAATALRDRLGPDDDALRDRLSELESKLGGASGAAGVASADSLDEPASMEPGTAGDDADSNEIDFSGLELPETDEAEPRADAQEPGAGEDQGLSFDIDENLEQDLASAAEAGAEEGQTDDDLNNLSFDLDENELPDLDAPASGGDSGEGQETGLDVDEELPASGEAFAAPESADAGEGPDGAGDDENVTRLSLAQAYADMGDAEGAQELIDEVLASGTDEQKREAEAIRDQIQGS
ncbi:FimV/HubP family polar landmark protein [Thioalkalivibrio sp. AKL19]|uniref:FimV/HubP family polar landmark protein n=1 Tax=Thioalkalivibrio sp. AKL19 TaxID=1266914 RepID=UPI0003F5D96A|nr:FimV/HubP family polar landmark protein [Thioalkalivibrio sp. AKL19]